MKSVFEFTDYRKMIKARIEQMPQQGHGGASRLAKYLRVHPSLLSQVFSGTKDLTIDQAMEAAEYFGLTEKECQYFLHLVLHARSGTAKTKKYWWAQIQKAQANHAQIVSRVSATGVLSDMDRGVYYSTWLNSAVRLATSLPGMTSADAVARKLGVAVSRVSSVLDFLVDKGLVLLTKQGYSMGAANTFVGSDSPHWVRHQQNWRLKAQTRIENMDPAMELFFTSPLSIAKKDIPRVREILLESIEKVSRVVGPSEAQELMCLNIDWFRVTGG